MHDKTSSRLYVTALLLICLIFSAALVCILLMGTTARYMADDYCYAVSLRGNFWLRQVNAYMNETTFSGNRFSLTLFTGISELFGAGNIKVLPPVMALAWLACLFFFSRQLPGLSAKGWLNRLEAFLVAEALEVFTLGMCTNWVQVYFWRAGMFPYLAPLVTGSLLMALLARALRRQKIGWLSGGLIFLFAWLTGGFSEVAVMVELSMLTAGLVCAGLLRKWRKSSWIPFAIGLSAALLAFILIISSPMNQLRMQRSYSQYAPLLDALVNSLKGGWTFILTTLYRPTLYFASFSLFFILLGWGIALRTNLPALAARKAFFWVAATSLLAYLVISAAMLPGFYAESSYPSDRALIIPRFVSLLWSLAVGLILGNSISGIKGKEFPNFILGVMLLSGMLMDILWITGMEVHYHAPAFPEMRELVKTHLGLSLLVLIGALLVVVPVVWKGKLKASLPLAMFLLAVPGIWIGVRFLEEYPIMQARARLWDGREAQIEQLKASGETDLVVPAMNSLAGILELSDQEGFWVNGCAAAYYRVGTISAVEPVLDPEQLTAP